MDKISDDTMCKAYAMCGNRASRLYDFGILGMIPACKRCSDKTDRIRQSAKR